MLLSPEKQQQVHFKNISIKTLTRSKTLLNSFWGVFGSGVQMLLLSLFFIILARKYDTESFALFLIAMTIYQFLAAFSALGLGQWFTREILKTEDKSTLIHQFLKIQLLSGIFFYLVSIAGAYLLYDNSLLHKLAIVIGLNIIFDNVIYGLKSLNIAEFRQKKTFIILFIDALLKFLAGCILLFYPIPVLSLSIILVGTRLLTLNLFLHMGSSSLISFRRLLLYPTRWQQVRKMIAPNWAFVIIGSVSIIYWRIGNLIVSKALPLQDVTHYEVSFKAFSLALVIPLMISATVFPVFVEKFKAGSIVQLKNYFHNTAYGYLAYSLLVYTFFYSFADFIMPFAFGAGFTETAPYTREMFLAVLVLPSVVLQANVIIAMHREKTDMWLNVISLIANVAFCLIGLYFYKSLTVINLAIFSSVVVFHVCQDVFLIRKKITTPARVLILYLLTGCVAGCYAFLSPHFRPVWFFVFFWLIVATVFALIKFGPTFLHKYWFSKRSLAILKPVSNDKT